MSRSRRVAVVPLPKHVFRVKGRKGQVYLYYQRDRGTERAGKLERLPEADSPEFWIRIKELGGLPTGPKQGTVRHLLSAFQKDDNPEWTKLRPASQRIYKMRLETMGLAWGDLDVSDITPKMVLELRDRLRTAPSVANQTIAIVRTVLKWAVPRGYTRVNAAREISDLDYEEDTAKPIPDDVHAYIVKTAPQLLSRLAVLGRATGQRASDLARMRPVDRRDNGMDMMIGKLRDKRHWVPIQATELTAIDAWGVEPLVPYLLSERRKRLNSSRLALIWRDWTMTEAGACARGFSPHDLRATAVCDRRRDGLEHQEIANELGMSVSMVMRYSRKIDQEAMAKVSTVKREHAQNIRLKNTSKPIAKRSGKPSSK